MKGPRRSHRPPEDRHNVADQPGGLILLIGLAIAVTMGLAIRGLIHPAKVRALMENAASRIHPDVKVSFESAHFSLANGLWPRFAVVITQVRMESSNSCWMAPRLFADEIRLPISLQRLLSGRSPLQRLEAGEVELRLTKARPTSCDGEGSSSSDSAVRIETEPVRPAVSLVQKTPRSELRASGEIEAVQIGRLSIVSETEPVVGTLDLDRFEFLVRSSRPRVFQLSARSHLLRDVSGVGDYLSHANLRVEYKEFPERALEMRVFGNWREGAYNVTAGYLPDTDQLALAADVRHLPLSQILNLLKKFKMTQAEFEPRQAWLSFRAEAAGSLDRFSEQGVAVTALKLEGDLAEVEAARIDIRRLSPFEVVPARFEIRKLDLDRLLQALQRPHPSSAINRLGLFRGRMEWTDPLNFRLMGDQSGLEFIFSNQGRRELQVVNGVRGEILRDKNGWRLRVDGADVEQGLFNGQVRLTADSEFENVDLQTRVDGLSLRPAVQQLMTRGGEIAVLQGQVQARFRQGDVTLLRGQLNLPELRLEGTTLEKVSMRFDDRAGAIQLTPRVERLAVSAGSAPWGLLGSALPESVLQDGWAVLAGVNGSFLLKGLNNVHWTRLGARIERGGLSLASEGGWDAAGQLEGRLTVRTGSRPKVWQIQGTRDQPVLSESRP